MPVMNPSDDQTKLLVLMSRLLAIAAILVSLALAACGDDEGSPTTTSPAQAAGSDPGAAEDASSRRGPSLRRRECGRQTAAGTEIKVSDSQFGQSSSAPQHQAIYLFDKENSATSRVLRGPRKAWPPC